MSKPLVSLKEMWGTVRKAPKPVGLGLSRTRPGPGLLACWAPLHPITTSGQSLLPWSSQCFPHLGGYSLGDRGWLISPRAAWRGGQGGRAGLCVHPTDVSPRLSCTFLHPTPPLHTPFHRRPSCAQKGKRIHLPATLRGNIQFRARRCQEAPTT